MSIVDLSELANAHEHDKHSNGSRYSQLRFLKSKFILGRT